jgi:hypothetical protein
LIGSDWGKQFDFRTIVGWTVNGDISRRDEIMRMFLTLAVLLTAAPSHSDPKLNRQLDRWRTLNEQCSAPESYNCKKKSKENRQPCEATTTACWERLALDKILISKGCEYQNRERPLDPWICR